MRTMQLQMIRKPSLFQSVLETAEEICRPTVNDDLTTQDIKNKGTPRHCTCIKRVFMNGVSLWNFRSGCQTSEVSRRCPYHPFSEPVVWWQYRLPFTQYWLSTAIDINLTIGSGAGGAAIPPFLRAVRVVPHDAPAFSVIDRLESRLDPFPRNKTQQDDTKAYKLAKMDLIGLFESGDASPSDIDHLGRDLFLVCQCN